MPGIPPDRAWPGACPDCHAAPSPPGLDSARATAPRAASWKSRRRLPAAAPPGSRSGWTRGNLRSEIATQRLHPQGWIALVQLRLAPQAGSPDDGSRRQRLQALAQVGHEAISRILSRGNGRQAKSLRHTHRNVLRGVHGKIGPPVLERGLELLYEKPLAADLSEGPIDDLVASRGDAEDAHLAMRIQALELARDVLGLPHCEPAPARGNDDSFRHLTQRLFPSLPAT